MEINHLFCGISNAFFAVIGVILGTCFIGFPCLVFIYFSGLWTGLAIFHFFKHVESRRIKTPTGKQSDA